MADSISQLSDQQTDINGDLQQQEVDEVFHNYRSVLRKFPYCLYSFKTPLQLAASLSKYQQKVKVAEMKQLERENLRILIPQGPRTRVSVDLLHILANQPRSWKLRIPDTLLSKGNSIRLLKTCSQGNTSVQVYDNETVALVSLNTECSKSPPGKCVTNFPRFVHKSNRSHIAFLPDFASAEELWKQISPDDQQLQVFVAPVTPVVSLIRAHWKQVSQKTIYYVTSNDTHQKSPIANARFDSHIVAHQAKRLSRSFIQHLPELSEKPNYEEQFMVSEKSSNSVTVKRVKPNEEIDAELMEVVKILENAVLKPHETVEEVVCDFVLDSKRRPVFLGCEGYTFATPKRALTKTVQPATLFDLNSSTTFLLYNDTGRNSKRKRTMAPSDDGFSKMQLPTEMSESMYLPERLSLPKLRNPTFVPVTKPDFRYTQISLAKITSGYDNIMSKVRSYKEELKGSVNLVEKYGGITFWRPILVHIAVIFKADERLKAYYEHLNFEEGEMLLRGYQRILEGNYNLYFKKSMTKVHAGKGIDSEVFYQFVHNVEIALDAFPILPADLTTIIQRFRSFESCICPKD